MLYVDTSALAKLVLAERESVALRGFLDQSDRRMVTSAITDVEFIRAVSRQAPDLEEPARALLETLVRVRVTEDVIARAGAVRPAEIRTLDAIHLATAIMLGEEVDALVTYDVRMIEGARAASIPTESPA